MARVVIADAGPLIAFAGIDRLVLLKQLFAEVMLLQSVKEECLAKEGVDAQRIKVALQQGWLNVHQLPQVSAPLTPSLGRNESDSIRFALESPDDSLLIMDDRLARRYALHKGLNIIGTVRLLDLAEQRALIESAEDCIHEMVDFGYRVSMDLLRKIRSK